MPGTGIDNNPFTDDRHTGLSHHFLIFDIRVLSRSGLSARAPECQKLKWWIRPVWR